MTEPSQRKKTDGKTKKPVRRRTAAPRGKSARNRRQAEERTMPVWVRNVLAFCIVVVFSAGFYWFFIRPYAYRWKPCYGLKGYGVCMPCDFEVHGVDMSHYQGRIDWPRLAEHPRAATIRTTRSARISIRPGPTVSSAGLTITSCRVPMR